MVSVAQNINIAETGFSEKFLIMLAMKRDGKRIWGGFVG